VPFLREGFLVPARVAESEEARATMSFESRSEGKEMKSWIFRPGLYGWRVYDASKHAQSVPSWIADRVDATETAEIDALLPPEEWVKAGRKHGEGETGLYPSGGRTPRREICWKCGRKEVLWFLYNHQGHQFRSCQRCEYDWIRNFPSLTLSEYFGRSGLMVKGSISDTDD
jgi:DNA-directed RNA polymerase subunit M/transcription elongation factor TFIIS